MRSFIINMDGKNMLKLRIIRTILKEDYTEGVLINVNNNEILCDTLEDTVRDINGDGDLSDQDEGKIYSKTAILYGKYSIEVTWSPSFKRDMVAVHNVPHFTGIRLHWGRTVENSEGCPLVGKKYDEGKLENIGMTDKLVELLREYGNKGEIEIV